MLLRAVDARSPGDRDRRLKEMWRHLSLLTHPNALEAIEGTSHLLAAVEANPPTQRTGPRMHIQPTTWRRQTRRVIAVAAASSSIAAATVSIASSATASPAPTVHHGAGTVIAHGTDYVGQYRVTLGGHTAIVYCINPTKRDPAHLSLSTVTRIPGLDTTTTREMAQVLTAHGQTNKLVQAEATSQALNYLAGNRKDVARRARYIAKSTQKLAMSYVAEAKRLRGGHTVKLHLSAAALPGQTGTGTVTVTGAGGAAATTVTLTHGANVSMPRAVRTNSHGTARFTYKTIGGSQVHMAATATGLAPLTVRVSNPAAGYQRMVSASTSISGHASAAYQGRVNGFSNSYACSSECKGHPVVTLRACAPASTYASRLTYSWAGGSKVASFAANKKAACTSVSVTMPDGLRVTASWQYRTGKGWTTKSAAAGSFGVDCPAAPPVAAALSYDCTAASFTATLGQQRNGSIAVQRNTTKHQMVLTVSGAVTGRFTLAPGATAAAHTWPITCGRHAQITIQSGIQRSGGGWNYGQPAIITAP